MDRTTLINVLCELNGINFQDNLHKQYDSKLETIYGKFGISHDEAITTLAGLNLNINYKDRHTPEWNLICMNLCVLHKLSTVLTKDDELLSVQQTKKLKDCLQTFTRIAVYSNLQPSLPFSKPTPGDAISSYDHLKLAIGPLRELLNGPLKGLVLLECLSGILVALYQIAYCPLKKPSSGTELVMTKEMYNTLIAEQEFYKKFLEDLRCSIPPGIFVKYTMILLQAKAPVWFKKAVSQNLSGIIRSKQGLEIIVATMLGGSVNDTARTWRTIEIISKLILSCKIFPDFQNNTCKQLVGLLDKDSLVLERVFTYCTKSMFNADEEVCKNVLVRRIITPFLYFTYKDHRFGDGDDLTAEIKQNIRLVYGVFVESTVDNPCLPLDLINSVINVFYRLYSVTVNNTSFASTNNELKEILIKFLTLHPPDVFTIFDSFLFNLVVPEFLPFRSDILLNLKQNANNIFINCISYTVIYSITENTDTIMILLKNNTDLKVKLFGYLLKCLTERDKYFPKVAQDLMTGEPELMNEFLERNLAVYKALSELTEDKPTQKQITEKPDDIIKYIQDVLSKTLQTKTHQTADFESEPFQTLFTIIMILQALVMNSSKSDLKQYETLIDPLNTIANESTNKELKDLINKTLELITRENTGATRIVVEDVKCDLDAAIEDICDALLPMRGHGLMTLTKLVEKKEKDVMERKQYILNIFQQNIKNDDSFIYLSAIGGLAAMAHWFPDTVLNILCEEYSDCKVDGEDGHEVRMKIGEALVRVTKLLGDMAPKYKPLLLNTFLNGSKDDDYLIRASSLSNLGEICRILGYKLGTIVTEVLVCVHAIITTDKSVEARRAAVTVIRQLFAGLDSEMIAFLKDDILPIYRSLKQIYNGDVDDVMRLQAQLALEELNENMKKFVFPTPQLEMEKKIIMLD